MISFKVRYLFLVKLLFVNVTDTYSKPDSAEMFSVPSIGACVEENLKYNILEFVTEHNSAPTMFSILIPRWRGFVIRDYLISSIKYDICKFCIL